MSDDFFIGTGADDNFNGGTDTDTVIFAGIAAGYRIDVLEDGRIQVVDINLANGDTGSDTLTSIEQLRFVDKTYALTDVATAPLDGEVQLNPYSPGDSQTHPAIAALSDGGYIATWASLNDAWDIYIQRFDSHGNSIGSATVINATTTGNQDAPKVTGLVDGGYVLTWQSNGQDGSESGVYAQRFDAAGNAVGSETRVNSYTTSYQEGAVVTALNDGGYLIAWQSWGQDGSDWGIYAQRFDANGNTVGNANRVNNYTSSYQTDAAVAALDNGGYVIAWSSFEQEGVGLLSGVYMQRFDAGGNPVGAEVRVNTQTADYQFDPDIASLADGSYVIAWTGQDGWGYAVYTQRFDINGNALGGETRVNTYTTLHQGPTVIAALADGGYVVAWQSDLQDGSEYGIYMQRFDADGNVIGGETLVNISTDDNQDAPVITALADGGFIIAWNSDHVDGVNREVYAQRFDAEGNRYALSMLEIAGTSSNDVLNAGAGDQTLQGLAGNDTLTGGAGIDTLIGGTGNDIYIVDEGDTLVEVSGGGTDTVQAGFNYTLANHLENLVLTGNFGLSGTGNSAANIISGNNGSNTLNGGAGADTLVGGRGNDSYVLDDYNVITTPSLGDTLVEAISAGTDSVLSVANHTLAANIENLTLTGSEAVDGTGNALANIITGNSAANSLLGSAGNDTLNGGEGDDFLWGGEGRDTLSGSQGDDIFFFGDSLSGRVDTIRDFNGSDDIIQLSLAVFAALGAIGTLSNANFVANAAGTAAGADDYIVYNTTTGDLYYDSNGNAAGSAQKFAVVTGAPVLSAADFEVV